MDSASLRGVTVLVIGATGFVGAIWTGIMARAQPPQSAASPLSFEVASVRANRSGGRIMLFQLIQYAYDVMQFQISGAPAWVKSDRYDIAAKAEGDRQVREIRAMLQRLLEDRFQLKYHWDTKEAAVYYLVVSKAGKLREAEPGDCPPLLSAPSSRFAGPPDAPCGSLMNSPGHTKGYKLTAGDLAGSLSFFLGRLVLDKTALTGKYDIALQWTPEPVQTQSAAPPEAGPPSIFTALQEQLGLKLESAKGPVKTLVIDHVARPSEN
jgi:uncharacterized protein (TIGR03435 family)